MLMFFFFVAELAAFEVFFVHKLRQPRRTVIVEMTRDKWVVMGWGGGGVECTESTE